MKTVTFKIMEILFFILIFVSAGVAIAKSYEVLLINGTRIVYKTWKECKEHDQ